jgi:hypothetical protein
MDSDTDIETDNLDERITDITGDQTRVINAVNNSPAQAVQMGPPPNATPALVLGIINNLAGIREQLQNNIGNMVDQFPFEYTDAMDSVMDFLQGIAPIQTIIPIIADDGFWSWYSTLGIDFLTQLGVLVEDENILSIVVDSLWDALHTGEGIIADTEDPEGEEHEGAGLGGSRGSRVPTSRGSLVRPFQLKPCSFY